LDIWKMLMAVVQVVRKGKIYEWSGNVLCMWI
jgi:hypothetical protein